MTVLEMLPFLVIFLHYPPMEELKPFPSQQTARLVWALNSNWQVFYEHHVKPRLPEGAYSFWEQPYDKEHVQPWLWLLMAQEKNFIYPGTGHSTFAIHRHAQTQLKVFLGPDNYAKGKMPSIVPLGWFLQLKHWRKRNVAAISLEDSYIK